MTGQTLRERFEEIGVPALEDIPKDMMDMVMRGMADGRTLCIVREFDPDGVFRATWTFLKPKEEDDY